MESAEDRQFPHNKAFQVLSILHVAFGTLSITLAIMAALVISHSNQLETFGFTYVAAGTWCGFVFLLTALATFLMTTRRSENYVFGAWLATAVSSIFACAMMSLELATTLTLASENYQTVLIMFHSMLVVIAICEIFLSIVTWAYCCRTQCCELSVFIPRVKFISGSDSVPFVNATTTTVDT